MAKIISDRAIARRNTWIDKIDKIDGIFASNSRIIEEELSKELTNNGASCLLDHLRLCGNIPESYGHDTSQEKQYSKYTDVLLSFAYKAIGLKSFVIAERADVADVEGFGEDFSFVADAKAFRLSRTAKNQKDFKVQAMDRWKHGKPYAMVVCPIYQLPSRNSQIYQQAITRNVCVFTYSHLALLVRYANEISSSKPESLLYEIFKTIPALNPSKSAVDYWLGVNKTILDYSKSIFELWQDEKKAAIESIEIAKVEALKFLASEREKVMRMSHEEAIMELLKANKIESKIRTIKNVSDNGLLEVK
ncbi:MAG: HindIII family type II restriction endonuclease [Bernardetiaceae bacterium]|nr:HindIII family type II restriction endonuclease [Bernardetiaceae bacterium]